MDNNNLFNTSDNNENEPTSVSPEVKEEEEVAAEPVFQDSTPIYTEKIKKPKKVRKKLFERPVAVAVLTAFVMCILFGGGLFLTKDAIKDYLLSDVTPSEKTELSDSVKNDKTYGIFTHPGTDFFSETPNSAQLPATAAVSEYPALTNQQIAATVSPSIVGISNLSFSPNSYLNINTLQSTGSGIIISDKGYIVTNNHVIANANKLKVTLSSGDELNAEIIGTDPQTDIAIIKVDPKDLTLKPATIGVSSTMQVGDEVFAIGNPLGLTLAGSVTHGIVSALNRKLTVDGTTYNLMQTDAAINSGNSGGALVNRRGEVIGINSVKISSDGVEGLGFAIPIDDVKDIIEDLISDGYVHGRPAIGVNIVEITPQLAYYYDLPVSYGLFVNEVIEGGSADIAGVEVGDIIIAFNGEKVTSTAAFLDKRNTYKAGDSITLTVNREGKEKDFTLKLQEDKPAVQ